MWWTEQTNLFSTGPLFSPLPELLLDNLLSDPWTNWFWRASFMASSTGTEWEDFFCNKGNTCCTARATAASVNPLTRRPLVFLLGCLEGSSLRTIFILMISFLSVNCEHNNIFTVEELLHFPSSCLSHYNTDWLLCCFHCLIIFFPGRCERTKHSLSNQREPPIRKYGVWVLSSRINSDREGVNT